MKKKEILKEVIAETLCAINEQNADIWQHNEPIPQIELDLILNNLQKLYENYKILIRLNNKEIEEDPLPPLFPSPKKHIDIAFTPKPQEADNIPSTEPPPEIKEAGKAIEDHAREAIPEEKTEQKIPAPEPGQKKPLPDLFSNQAPTVADQFKSTAKTIQDKISEDTEDKSLASRLQKSPIRELKSYIGINDRFIFMNEMFGGDMMAYNETINKFDQCKHLSEAKDLISEIKITFSMDTTLDSYKKFNGYIERKFSDEH